MTKDEGVCQKMIVETKDGEKSASPCNGKLIRTLSDKFDEEKQNSALFAAMQSKLIIVMGSTLKRDPSATIPMAT